MRHLNKLVRTSVIAGLLATTAVVGGGTASAATAPTSQTVTPSGIVLCTVKADFANVPINKTTNTNSTVVGHLTKGEEYPSECTSTVGADYSACRGIGFRWWLVSSPAKGYVKLTCVTHIIRHT